MTRVIRKYANRRLYDTGSSSYITLDDLKKLIVSGTPIEVQDAKTRKDITRDVLLQLVAEQESLGRPILNEAILVALIRFYDHPMQKLASSYVETALSHLQDQRTQLGEQMQALMDSPAELFSQLTRQNMERMDQLQKAFLSAMNPGRADDSGSSD